jgi:GT2 family glycosyltransferase
MTTVSAILPTFNRSAMVCECLDSLLGQTRRLDQIIVVNDGSTDGTRDVLAKYGASITVIEQANAGKARALNAGLERCTEDYVWICDDDDIADARGTEHLARALDADGGLSFVYGTFQRFFDGKAGREFAPPSYWTRAEEDSVLINVLEECFTFQFAQLVRRAAFERVGGFQENLIRSQDYEMFIRLARSGRSLYIPEVIFYQRQHGGSRGAADGRFSAIAQQAKWLQYDQMFFRELRGSLRLDEIVPKFARDLAPAVARRAALVQRACIFAQRALWEFALEDVEEACRADPGASPLPGETHLAAAVVRNRLAWDALMASPIDIARLRACGAIGSYARAITTALLRPVIWHARQDIQAGRFGAALVRLRFVCAALGYRGGARRVLQSLAS